MPVKPKRAEVVAVPWSRGLLLTALAWVVMLCAGFGGTLGGSAQALAHKLAAQAQLVLRPSGSSLGARAARRDGVQLAAARLVAEPVQAVVPGGADLAPPTQARDKPAQALAAGVAATAFAEPRLKRHRLAPPGRAPPAQA